MPVKKGFSERAWDEIINADTAGAWIDSAISVAKKRPADPFADTGPLLEAMLKRGVTREQLCRLARAIRYEAVFETVQLAAEEGLDAAQLEGVHEELLCADPSGRDGRPGPSPAAALPAPKSVRAATPRPKPARAAAKARVQSRVGAGHKAAGEDAPRLTLPKGDDFAFSPDGSRLWLAHTSINSSTVRGVSIPGGAQFAEFNSLPNLRRLACSPDAKWIASGNHDGIVALHDATSGKERWRGPKTGEETRCVAYAPDGSMVLNSGSNAGRVRRLDARTGKELRPLELGTGWVTFGLALSPDGGTLAVGAVEVPGKAHLSYWDWRTARELGRHAVGGVMAGVVFVPGGSVLAAYHKSVEVWNLKTKRRTSHIELEHGSNGVSVHRGGRLLAVNTYGGPEVRELPSGRLSKRLETQGMRPTHWAFSPDGRHALLVASPKSYLWELGVLLG